jgi:hypothetical protein
MSGREFLQHASKALSHQIEYDSELDDTVSLYDNNDEMEMEEIAEPTASDKKRKRVDEDGLQIEDSNKKLKK